MGNIIFIFFNNFPLNVGMIEDMKRLIYNLCFGLIKKFAECRINCNDFSI